MSEQLKRQRVNLLNTTTRVIELIPNLLFIAVYLLATLSPFISPIKTQIPAFLNLAYPVLLIGLLILWLFYLLRRKWIYFITYTVIAIFSSGYILTYYPLNFGTGLREEHQLRVLSYNAQSFLGRDDNGQLLVPKLIKEYDPDIVALQEANVYPEQYPTEAQMIKHFKQYPYRHVHKTQAFLSKYPILLIDEVKYDSPHNGSCGYIIELPNGVTILVVNNHLESYSLNTSEKEEYKGYIKDFKLADLPDQILKVKRRLGPQLNQRAAVAQRVRRETSQLQSRHDPLATIVLGDLNDTPMSYTYWQLKNGMHDAYKETGRGLGISFNERLMPFRIDHLFYEGDIEAIGSIIPKYKSYSDHNPLIVDFKWDIKN